MELLASVRNQRPASRGRDCGLAFDGVATKDFPRHERAIARYVMQRLAAAPSDALVDVRSDMSGMLIGLHIACHFATL